MYSNIGILLKMNPNFIDVEIRINIYILEPDITKMDIVFLVVLLKILY